MIFGTTQTKLVDALKPFLKEKMGKEIQDKLWSQYLRKQEELQKWFLVEIEKVADKQSDKLSKEVVRQLKGLK